MGHRAASPDPSVPVLHVVSRPSGAHVAIDGVLVTDDTGPATTPVDVPVESGRHRIDITLSGYEDFTTRVNLRIGQRRELSARLMPSL